MKKKTIVTLPKRFTDRVEDIVGLDDEGCILLKFGETQHVALTPCCFADGTGSDYGILCRSCHENVHPKHGMSGVPIAIGREDLEFVIES